jgi:hypothetical protein|tara:strand:+ start:552 stop:740 length:189 start_codon:yes stop_codon:yes gene_type:complete
MQWYSDFGHLTRDVIIIYDPLGEPMEKLTRPTFSPEFILEALQFVVMRISGAFGHYVGVSCK